MTRLFREGTAINVRACDSFPSVDKANAYELAKPTGVVISLCLCIAKRILEDRVGLKNGALQ